jgi:hypothetical protein
MRILAFAILAIGTVSIGPAAAQMYNQPTRMTSIQPIVSSSFNAAEAVDLETPRASATRRMDHSRLPLLSGRYRVSISTSKTRAASEAPRQAASSIHAE